ncbi:NAD(P)/FAD-dependent oxidoreductase [Halodurantibacterium flavum]|uniref:NAD(P)/FAD-dependent oxidoreductase n=1 Tax=Halodurantibacterium flavum TaxID=1382802 RepID=A0ABW4S2X4_9RHOB
MTSERYDVIIVGGAVMGSSAAFWLTRMQPDLSVLVIEMDPSYAYSATALSVASIRQQFTNPVNVEISRFGIGFIRDLEGSLGREVGIPSLGLRENGYLFLAGTSGAAATMQEVAAMQRALGAGTEVLDADALAARFPWLRLDDVTAGSFGPSDEGWFDNMGLLNGFRLAARAQGAEYLVDRVTDLLRAGERITGVRLASGQEISCGALINAAGTRAADILRTAGEDIPVEPRKRTVFMIDAPNARHPDAPLIVDHTGFYLRPEGEHWITAIVPEGDGPVDPSDFEPRASDFEDLIWPRLYDRAPGFDAVKVLRWWVGHYDYNTLDQNAIVGRLPGLANLYLMNGFSGHGLQQAPAVGRGIAELIMTGGYRTIDMTPLGAERLQTNTPFAERAII